MMVLAEKSFNGCNSIVYFVITIKGTGEEPKSLGWMAFSFFNLMAFLFAVRRRPSRQGVWEYFQGTSMVQDTVYLKGNDCAQRCQLTTFKLKTDKSGRALSAVALKPCLDSFVQKIIKFKGYSKAQQKYFSH